MRARKFKTMVMALICFTGLPVSFLAFGSDLQTQQSNLYPYRSTISLQDEFISGGVTSQLIGALGWSLSGGTGSVTAAEAGRPGLLNRTTSAVINTNASTALIGTSSAMFANEIHSILFVLRLNTNDANTRVQIGTSNSAFTPISTNGIYFEKNDADTNWFCVTRSGGVQTRTDSGIAVSTSFATFFYSSTPSSVRFSINNTQVCTHTTNLPTTAATPNVIITNSAAAAKTLDIDYFQMTVTGLSR